MKRDSYKAIVKIDKTIALNKSASAWFEKNEYFLSGSSDRALAIAAYAAGFQAKRLLKSPTAKKVKR